MLMRSRRVFFLSMSDSIMLHSIVIFLAASQFAIHCQAQTLEAADFFAMTNLRMSLSGSSLTSGWSSTDPCAWTGVACDASTPRRVTSIVYNQRLVSGSLPTHIGMLTALRTFVLADNRLSGTIPTHVGLMTSLREFDFHLNQLSGPIPTHFANIQSLNDLILHNNRLTGVAPPQLESVSALSACAFQNNFLTSCNGLPTFCTCTTIVPTPAPPPEPTAAPSGNGLFSLGDQTVTMSIGVYIGIVVAVILVVCAAVLVVVFVLRSKRRRGDTLRQKSIEMPVQSRPTSNNANDNINNQGNYVEPLIVAASNRQPQLVSNASNYAPSPQIAKESNYGALVKLSIDATDPLYRYLVSSEDVVMNRELGRGEYGVVYEARLRGQKIACKTLSVEKAAEINIEDFRHEALTMAELPVHPNVVKMIGFTRDATISILLEYIDGGSLQSLVYDQDRPLTSEQCVRFLIEILSGLAHLHSYNIIHRDLAARNVLVRHGSLQCVLTDFGFSRKLGDGDDAGQTVSSVGPMRWMAPEQIIKKQYSRASDVWAFGVTASEILNRERPYDHMENTAAAIEVGKGILRPSFAKSMLCPAAVSTILDHCFAYKPDDRWPVQRLIDSLVQLQPRSQSQNPLTTTNRPQEPHYKPMQRDGFDSPYNPIDKD